MSIAKPFVFALVCDTVGIDEVRRRVNATGLAFNSASAVERDLTAGRTRWSTPAPSPPRAWCPASIWRSAGTASATLSQCAGRPLALDEDTLASARATSHRNRALANLLTGLGALQGDPSDAVEIYTRQSCLAVLGDLAVMGATLAGGGTNPLTGTRVFDPRRPTPPWR
jgi:glutaminase